MANWLGEDPPTRWLDPHARTMYREPSHAAPPPPSFNPADHLPPCGQVRTPNSFTGMSQHTQDRTAKLQSLLSKTLGPDQVANRPGGGGTKLSYLEGWRAINLANEIFGYNGWYTDIKYLEADFIDYSPESQRWSIGVTAIVRVRLQDGASHEDVGYGKLENSKSKADALDKCKKEAVTDALKRALRHFGKLLGNCLYDKNYLEGLSKMKAPKPKFDFEGIYKPDRDNVRPTASSSAVPPTPASTMPPPPPPAPRPAAAAASLPKKEPAKGPPPLPPHLAAQAHRASTVASRTAAAAGPAAPAPGARASSGPTPRRAATVAAPSSIAAASAAAATSTSTSASTSAGGPNPYDRAGAQTEFPLNSDDESMFAAVELGVEAEGGEDSMMGEGGVEAESRTGQGCFEGDSGFGEVDGLGETSFLSAKPPFAAPPSMPTLVPHPQQQQQQQRRPSPASTSASDSPKDPSDRLQAAKAAAQERLALAQAKKRREQANSPHTPASAPPHRRATIAGDGHGAGAGGGGAGGTARASAAERLRLGQGQAQGQAHGPALALGTARPPALRPPQVPPSRSNSATSTGAGSAGAAPASRPQAKVAGLLPALAVGAGVVRAATSGGAAAVGGGGVNVASLGGVSGLVGVSPERLRSAAGAAVEVPSQGGFVSARGVKRGVGEGYDPSPPAHSGGSGPRASYSPRAPLGELDVDGVTGVVKRQKGLSG